MSAPQSWSNADYFIAFYHLGHALYFTRNPVKTHAELMKKSYSEVRQNFAKEFANEQMAKELNLRYNEETAKWEIIDNGI